MVEDQTLDVISIGLESVTTFATCGEMLQRLDHLTKKKSLKKNKKSQKDILFVLQTDL